MGVWRINKINATYLLSLYLVLDTGDMKMGKTQPLKEHQCSQGDSHRYELFCQFSTRKDII